MGLILDTKDRKLLLTLDFNARMTNAQLAKKVGLSKQGVDYRLKRMMNQGVILGYYPVVDIHKLGYIYGRLLLKFYNLTRKEEKKVFDELVADRRFNWILKGEGNYDMVIVFFPKDLQELKELSEELSEKYGVYLRKKKESVGIDVDFFPSRYIMESRSTRKIKMKEQETINTDKLDRNVLKLLCENARMSLIEMSKKLDVSAKVLAYRIKRLEKNEIILGYRPNINYNLLGYSHYKILFYLMNIKKESLKKFRQYLAASPKTVFLVREVGICDVDVEVMLKDEERLFEFLRDIKDKFPTIMKDYERVMIADTLKINYLPF